MSKLSNPKRPTAPKVFRPQPVPKVLQTKSAMPQPPAIVQSRKVATGPSIYQARQPVAPPVYRPQPAPRVLQTKSSSVQMRELGQAPLRAVVPPIYHLQPKAIGVRRSNTVQRAESSSSAIPIGEGRYRLPSGGVIRTSETNQAGKRGTAMRTLVGLKSRPSNPLLAEKIATLEKFLAEDPEVPENQVAFECVMSAQTPTNPNWLFCKAPGFAYMVGKNEEQDDEVANGTYRFVIPLGSADMILVTKDPFGHQSIAGGRYVLYAGTAYFSDGSLLKWNNDTGHYKTMPMFRFQATGPTMGDGHTPLLPLSKFEAYHA